MKSRQLLTIILVVLALFASSGGLFIPSLYRETDYYKVVWMSNDLITLVIAIPMTLAAMVFSNTSERSKLIWCGVLGYFLYNYAFYLFGTNFNYFFLLYVSIFALSFYAFIISLLHIDPADIESQFKSKKHLRPVAVYLIAVVLPLAWIEGNQYVDFILHDKSPTIPKLVLALDLSLIIPTSIVAGVLLWMRKGWGYILSVIMLVKGFIYGLVLATGAYIVDVENVGELDPLFSFYLVLVFGGMICLVILLRQMRKNVESA